MQPEAVLTNIANDGVWNSNPSFISLYKGRNCIFCEAAKEILYETLELYGLTKDVVREIDLDDPGVYPSSDISVLPSIRIYHEVFTGLPDQDQIGTAIARAFMTGCLNHIL